MAQSMRAAVLLGVGGTENIKIASVPVPKPAKGEILLRVGAVDINPVEWKIRSGTFVPTWMTKAMGAAEVWPPKEGPHKQYVIGVDAAGIVEDSPPNSRFNKGARVVVRKTDFTDGTLAEFATAKEKDTALVPDNVSLQDAVALSLSGLTAAQAMDFVKAPPGSTMLVNGGAGGVGAFAVQLAVLRGLKVTATASAANFEKVKSLGAEKVLDYRQVNYEQYAEQQGGFDVILDTVGNSQAAPSSKLLKKNGVFVRLATAASVGSMLTLLLAKILYLLGLGPRYEMVFSLANGKQLEGLVALLGQGKLRSHIAKTFSFAESAQAHQAAEEGANGKVVIVVDPNIK